VSESWVDYYRQITDFITGNAGIQIDQRSVTIPADLRPQFYSYFNLIIEKLLAEKLPDILFDSVELAREYSLAEAQTVKLLKLENITSNPRLESFLKNPVSELNKEVLMPLFDLLQSKISADQFEKYAVQNTILVFRRLFRAGYEAWAIVSLLNLLAPDKMIKVKTPPLDDDDGENIITPDQVSLFEDMKNLLMAGIGEGNIAVPEMIVRSSKTNSYVGFKAQPDKVTHKIQGFDNQRKWYPIDSISPINMHVELLYSSPSPDDIAITADCERICKPDLLLFTRGFSRWYENNGMDKIRPIHYGLKPKLGTFIISRDIIEASNTEDEEEGIHIIQAEYDGSKLKQVLACLIDKNSNVD